LAVPETGALYTLQQTPYMDAVHEQLSFLYDSDMEQYSDRIMTNTVKLLLNAGSQINTGL